MEHTAKVEPINTGARLLVTAVFVVLRLAMDSMIMRK